MILYNKIYVSNSEIKEVVAEQRKVLFITLGSNLLYDTLNYIEYDNPSITIEYNTSLSALGETSLPIINAELIFRRIGHSSNIYEGGKNTDYQISYSIAQDSNGFTLNSSTGEVKCSNNKTTSKRYFKINVVVTMTNTGDLVSKIITFIQNEGVQTTGNSEWVTNSITLSANTLSVGVRASTVNLSTIAKQTRKNYVFWNGIVDSYTEENQDVTVTPLYDEYESWASISGNTLSIDTNHGTSQRSVEVIASYLGYTSSITIKQSADYITGYSYGYPSISSFSYNNADYSGGTINPSGSYTLSVSNIWASGDITTGDTISGSIDDSYTTYSGSATGATLNSTTGAITWQNNTGTSSRSINVTATVYRNGYSATKTTTCTQNAPSIIKTEYIISINTSAYSGGAKIPASGGKCTVTCDGKIVNTYQNGTTSESSFTPNWTLSNSAGFTKSGNTITISENKTTDMRTATITASYLTHSKTIQLTQEADYITSYADSVNASVSPTLISAAGGTATVTVSTRHRTNTWASGRTTTTELPYAVGVTGTGYSISGHIVTVSANTNTTSRNGTITVSAGDAVKTLTLPQEADAIVSYGTPTILIGSGITAAKSLATVVTSVTDTWKSGNKSGSVTWSITDNGNSRFSLEGNTLKHESMTTNATTDNVTITAVNASDKNKTKTATLSVTNKVESTTVNKVLIDTFMYPVVQNQKAGVTSSPTTRTYLENIDTYTSGSTKTNKVSNSSISETYTIESNTIFTIDKNSGRCTTKSASTTTSDNCATVTLKATYGTKSATATASVCQLGIDLYTCTINNNNADIYGTAWTVSTASSLPYNITPAIIYDALNQTSVDIKFNPGAGLPVCNANGNKTTASAGTTVYVLVNKGSQGWQSMTNFKHLDNDYTINVS